MNRFLLLALSAFLLSGCGSFRSPEQQTATDVARMTSVHRNSYGKSTVVVGQVLQSKRENYRLAARKEDGWITEYALLLGTVRTPISEPLSYQEYFDEEGTQLSLVDRGRKRVRFRENLEVLAIGLERDYLDRHAATGVKIHAKGEHAEQVFELLPNQISGFLQVVDKTLK